MSTKTWAKKLFASRTARPAASAVTARRAAPRLGVERLDDRTLPSVTAVLSNAVLTITPDTYSTEAWATSIGNSVLVRDNFQGTVGVYNRADISRVAFAAGPNAAKWYGMHNETDLPTDMVAGPGTNSFFGGNGITTFHGNPAGRDTFYAGAGANVLVPNGTHDAITAWNPTGQVGPIVAAGLSNGTPTSQQLTAEGSVGVSLSPDRTTLTVAGPSGIGFQLRGAWDDRVSKPSNNHTYKVKGAVTLVTGSVLGDIPFNTLGAPITVTTTGLSTAVDARASKFAGMTWAGGLPLSTSGGSPLGSVLDDMGMDFSGGGMAWGLALGSELKSGSTGLKDAPLNSAVPYLYVSLGSGDGSAASVSYGGNSASVGSAAGIHLALDPADPFFYAKVATGTVAGTWSAGYSQHGVIPFTPLKSVPGFSPEDVRGNLYVKGDGIALGDLPVSVSGEVVLDLDANDRGQPVSVGGRSLGAVLKSGGEALGSVLNNVRLGVNGSVALGYKLGGIDLSLPAGSATVMYVPGRLGLHGGHDNPFDGTPLEKFAPRTGEIDLQGSIDWTRQGWGFSLTGTQTEAPAGGFFASRMSYTISNTGISATQAFTLDLGIATADATANFSLQYVNRALALHVGVEANFVAGAKGFDIHGHLSLDMNLTTDFHGVNIEGRAHATGGVKVFGVSKDFDIADATINNSGFSVKLPFSKRLAVKW